MRPPPTHPPEGNMATFKQGKQIDIPGETRQLGVAPADC
jgi:hypothetical protein